MLSNPCDCYHINSSYQDVIPIMKHLSIAFIGAGNMTSAIVSGMVQQHYPSALITATNRSLPKLEALQTRFNINVTQDNIAAINQADVVVLAVKPQLMADLCDTFPKDGSLSGKLFISIAAGLDCQRIYTMLGDHYPLVRTMPNTPSSLGVGLTGLFSENANAQQRQYTEDLFNMVGTTVWAETEAQINAVIAGAGSAPAYFYLFLEAMQNKVTELGFAPDDARAMVQQAMLGAAHMVIENNDLSLNDLRQQVMSKGGTTAKAIEHFQAQNLEQIVSDAMQAAVNRAEEMAKLF